MTLNLGIRELAGVTFVSLPNMNATGKDEFFAELEARRDALRQARLLVLDVRGNSGGSSAVGERALSILFGQDLVGRISESFDWTVDWRASPGNAEELRRQARADDGDLPREIDAAIGRGDDFVRRSGSPVRLRGRAPLTPFRGDVFLLTDGACASACLDFADIARRLPRVMHVGQPTSGDAIYIDNRQQPLPSGLAALSFGMKVYRNRVRGHNQWYAPALQWPGGAMTDEAVAAWLVDLASRGTR